MAKEKWSAGIDVREGSLKKLGWPDAGKLVAAARSDRKLVVGKLNYLANITKDPATKAKAHAIIERIKRELGES